MRLDGLKFTDLDHAMAILPPQAAVLHPYAPVGLLVLLAAGLAIVIVALSHKLSATRAGAVKDAPYESGMPAIGDARRRFNVKFYIVAMLFLLFDVEIVFLWPWAPIFFKSCSDPDHPLAAAMTALGFTKGVLLLVMAVFLGILLLGYVYAWRRGVFRWS